MNGEFSPIGALFLAAWLGAGSLAILAFFRHEQPTTWYWVSLIVGVAMVALGIIIGGLGVYSLWRIHE